MGCCTAKAFVITVCAAQLLSTIQREIFDFLGYMWTPIIGNFFQLICVIFGIFGVHHFKPKYLTVYAVWSLLWLGWNIFVICFYLEVGTLHRDLDILNMGTGSRSWFATNGIGCKTSANFTSTDSQEHAPPAQGCILEFYYVECIQAGLQCLLSVFGFLGAIYVIHIYTQEDDSWTKMRNPNGLPYSIEYNTSAGLETNDGAACQRPMTPRKVKRRSTRSKRGSSYRQSYYQNPVTKLMERSMDTSSNDSFHHRTFYQGQSNPLYHTSRPPDPLPPGPPLPAYLYRNEGITSPVYVNDSETVI